MRLVRRQALTELIRKHNPISFAHGHHQPLEDEPIARYALISGYRAKSTDELSLHPSTRSVREWIEERDRSNDEFIDEAGRDLLHEIDIDSALSCQWQIIDLDSGLELDHDDLPQPERPVRERISSLAG
ncbi:MAG: hypothetical protein ACRDPA_11505 [Solirubrobacteraceae bacterium]